MATTTQADRSSTKTRATAGQGLVGGILGGLAGGLVFGMMMQLMDFMPMIAMLVDSDSVAVAWVVHLAISAFIGAIFGLAVSMRPLGLGALAGAGVAYGVLWWVLGPLLLMPAKLGMPLFQFDSMTWKSLMGHMIFGVVLGLVTGAWLRRASNHA
jgi:hypothetical protein